MPLNPLNRIDRLLFLLRGALLLVVRCVPVGARLHSGLCIVDFSISKIEQVAFDELQLFKRAGG